MGLISKLKQSLGVDKLDTQEAKEILQDLKAEIEAEEKATAQEEITAQQIKDKEWASRVIEAQSNIQKRNRRHINAQKQSRISPQRQAHLRKLGKL